MVEKKAPPTEPLPLEPRSRTVAWEALTVNARAAQAKVILRSGYDFIEPAGLLKSGVNYDSHISHNCVAPSITIPMPAARFFRLLLPGVPGKTRKNWSFAKSDRPGVALVGYPRSFAIQGFQGPIRIGTVKLGNRSRLTDWRLQFSQLFDCARNELAGALKVRFGIEAAKREAQGPARALPA